MVNFKVIENAPPEYLEKYEEFIELYNNPKILKKNIPRILGWNQTAYKRARKQAIDEGLISSIVTKENPRYYHYIKERGKWVVSKDTKTVRMSVTCQSEIEAQTLVEYLKKHGWTRANVYTFQREIWPCHENNPLYMKKVVD